MELFIHCERLNDYIDPVILKFISSYMQTNHVMHQYLLPVAFLNLDGPNSRQLAVPIINFLLKRVNQFNKYFGIKFKIR